VNRRPWPARHGRRAACGSPRLNSRAWLGQRDHQRARPAEQGGDRCGSACSGEAATNVCWPAAQASSVGACGGDVGPTRCGEVRRTELGCGQPWRLGGGARKGTTARSGAREWEHPFYRHDRMVEWDSASSRRHRRRGEGERPGTACVGGGRGVGDRRGRAWRACEPQG
jgi:hypothetical protein